MKDLNIRIHHLYYPVFFLYSWIWLFFFTDYIFFYQEKSSLFLTTPAFLFEHLKQPGGLLNYLWHFQSALYFYPLAGSFLVSSEIVAIGYLIDKCSKISGREDGYPVSFLIIFTLFFLQLNYRYQGFNTLGILIQVGFFYLTIRYLKNVWLWVAVFVFPGLYFFTGFFSVIFLFLFISHLLTDKTNHNTSRWITLILLSGISFYAGREWLFYQTDLTLLLYPYTPQHTGMQSYIFLPLAAFIGFLPFIFRITGKLRDLPWFKKTMLFSPVVLFVLMVVVSVFSADKHNAHYFHVEKLFYEQKYDQVTEYNLKHPSLNTLTGFFNNISLCETGKLNDQLFFFPQSPDGSTLFLKWEMITEVLKRGGYWYYSLGLVNEANRWAYENMVMKGNTPEGIKMLAKTEIINGNYTIAQKYISILKSTLFHRKDALADEKLLYNESAINSHPEYGKKRKQKPKADFFVLTDNPLANLELLVKSDSSNAAAVDYIFAWWLLQKDMPKIVENLPLLEKAGFISIPLHIDEAATGFKLVKMGDFPRMQRLDISAPVIRRFDQFYRILQQNNTSKQQAQHALSKEFPNTFWYYYFFM